MLIVYAGGPNSGKSAMAEKRAVEIAERMSRGVADVGGMNPDAVSAAGPSPCRATAAGVNPDSVSAEGQGTGIAAAENENPDVVSAAGEGETYRSSAWLYYVATMIPYGEEGKERVDRHRAMRSGKGFITIERPYDVEGVLPDLEDPSHSVILLECAANLVANELYRDNTEKAVSKIKKLLWQVSKLESGVFALIIVTDFFRKEERHDAETSLYIDALNLLNKYLFEKADEVIKL